MKRRIMSFDLKAGVKPAKVAGVLAAIGEQFPQADLRTTKDGLSVIIEDWYLR